jgi:sugar lactone lactonase YvrE
VGGTLSAVAGVPALGKVGDGGPAVQALLKEARGLGFAQDGSLVFVDVFHNRLRRVDALSGTISTIAGIGVWGNLGDGGPAVQAQLGNPHDVDVDPSGQIYIGDKRNDEIRRIDLSGTIHTYCGTGVETYNGDGIPRTQAALNQPQVIRLSPNTGALYIGDFRNNRIRRVDAVTGIVTTLVGTGSSSGISGEGAAASVSICVQPAGLAIDSTETIYYSETTRNVVRKVTPGGLCFTVAGVANSSGYNGDGIAALAAFLNQPSGIDLDAVGNIYIAEQANNRVRRVDTAGFIETVCGNGIAGSGADGVLPTQTMLNSPVAVRVDRHSNIYVSEFLGSRVRRFRTYP